MMSSSLSRSLFTTCTTLFMFKPQLHKPVPILPLLLFRPLSTSPPKSGHLTNPTASFDWSDDEQQSQAPPKKQPTTTNLPPPYNPFNKTPTTKVPPSDPSNLQQIFHDMGKNNGLFDAAVRMFDALSQHGLTHEAMELFKVIKDKSTMPDVVAHTAVIEAYANAGGHWKDAVRTYERMLASGVMPNVYTYSVLIKGLGKDGRVGEAKKYLLDMVGKGMKPNVGTCIAVLEACVREGKVEEGRRVVEEMKEKGVVFDEKEVREFVGKRGQMFRSIMGMVFGK